MLNLGTPFHRNLSFEFVISIIFRSYSYQNIIGELDRIIECNLDHSSIIFPVLKDNVSNLGILYLLVLNVYV